MDKPPDVVLLDLALPSMNGLEVLKKIREFDSQARVIVVTGYSSNESTEIAFKCGTRELIVKPFEQSQLIEAIRDVMAD